MPPLMMTTVFRPGYCCRASSRPESVQAPPRPFFELLREGRRLADDGLEAPSVVRLTALPDLDAVESVRFEGHRAGGGRRASAARASIRCASAVALRHDVDDFRRGQVELTADRRAVPGDSIECHVDGQAVESSDRLAIRRRQRKDPDHVGGPELLHEPLRRPDHSQRFARLEAAGVDREDERAIGSVTGAAAARRQTRSAFDPPLHQVARDDAPLLAVDSDLEMITAEGCDRTSVRVHDLDGDGDDVDGGAKRRGLLRFRRTSASQATKRERGGQPATTPERRRVSCHGV